MILAPQGFLGSCEAVARKAIHLIHVDAGAQRYELECRLALLFDGWRREGCDLRIVLQLQSEQWMYLEKTQECWTALLLKM